MSGARRPGVGSPVARVVGMGVGLVMIAAARKAILLRDHAGYSWADHWPIPPWVLALFTVAAAVGVIALLGGWLVRRSARVVTAWSAVASVGALGYAGFAVLLLWDVLAVLLPDPSGDHNEGLAIVTPPVAALLILGVVILVRDALARPRTFGEA